MDVETRIGDNVTSNDSSPSFATNLLISRVLIRREHEAVC